MCVFFITERESGLILQRQSNPDWTLTVWSRLHTLLTLSSWANRYQDSVCVRESVCVCVCVCVLCICVLTWLIDDLNPNFWTDWFVLLASHDWELFGRLLLRSRASVLLWEGCWFDSPLVCMSMCPWARCWTPNCSWCVRHLARQPPPPVYECTSELQWVSLDKSVC